MSAATCGWSSMGWRKLPRPSTRGDLRLSVSGMHTKFWHVILHISRAALPKAQQLLQMVSESLVLHGPRGTRVLHARLAAAPKHVFGRGSVCCRAAAGWPPALMNLSAGAGGSGSTRQASVTFSADERRWLRQYLAGRCRKRKPCALWTA